MAPKEASSKVQRSQTIDQPDQVLPETPKPEFKIPDGFRDVATETFLIFLAAITSRLSQLSLAPVYGSIPSSVNHQAAIGAVALIGWSSQSTFRHNNAPDLQKLPLWAVCAPILTCISFQFSDSLGLTWGPIVGGLLSCYSIILPIMYAAAASHEGSSGSSGPLVHLLSGIPSLGLFMILDWVMADTVNTFVATWSFLNPFNAQLIAGLYMLFALTDRRTIITATVSIATIAAIISPSPSQTDIMDDRTGLYDPHKERNNQGNEQAGNRTGELQRVSLPAN
jgi:hypothetical protein